jgi:uncharacterized protein (DUF1330 family)
MPQLDPDPCGRERSRTRLRPLHEDHRVLEVRLEIPPLGGRDAFEAVEVEVGDLDAVAVVAVADRVGRARHALAYAERAARAADEGRLPGAELPRDGDHVAEREPPRELGRERLRLLRRVALLLHAYDPSMPAYVIVETDVHDPEQYEQYKAASPDAVHSGGGRFIVRGGELAVLEGDWDPSRLVVLEFPDLEAAKRWYDSPEYEEAKRLRQGAANLRMVAVQGLDEPL